MTTLETLVTIAALGAVAGATLLIFGLFVAWLQWRRLGWWLHALGAGSLMTSAFIVASVQAAFHLAQTIVIGDYIIGLLFAAWMVLAARAAYRSPALSRAVQPSDQRTRGIRRHSSPT